MSAADTALTVATCIVSFLVGWFLGVPAVIAFVIGYAIGLAREVPRRRDRQAAPGAPRPGERAREQWAADIDRAGRRLEEREWRHYMAEATGDAGYLPRQERRQQ